MNLFQLGNSSGKSTTPTTGSIFGAGGSSSLFSKPSAASSTAAPSSLSLSTAAAPAKTAAPAKPAADVTTVGAKFEPQALPGGAYKCASILYDQRFRGYAPLELRVYDYVKMDRIQKLPPQPEKPAAAASAPSLGLSGGLFGGAAKDATKPTAFGAVQDHGEAVKINWSSAAFPAEPPHRVESAAQFFQPTPKPSRDLRPSDGSRARGSALRACAGYAALFQSTVPRSGAKLSAAPLLVDAAALRCAAPPRDQSALCDRSAQCNRSGCVRAVPSLREIGDARCVRGLRLESAEHGAISFSGAVDASAVDLQRDVAFGPRFVDVYRRKKDMPRAGEGINCAAEVTLFGVFPKDARTCRRAPCRDAVAAAGYSAELCEYCRSKGIAFRSYEPQRGTLTFSVESFANGPFEFP